MNNFYDVLKQYVSENQPNFGDGESVLTLLYEAYSECKRHDACAKIRIISREIGGIGYPTFGTAGHAAHLLQNRCSSPTVHRNAPG